MKRWLGQGVRAASSVLLMVFLIANGQVGAIAPCYTGACQDSTTMFGQTQAYDVLLRGNSEAVVTARVTLTNANSEALTKLSYTLASGKLGTVRAFQQLNCQALPILDPTGVSTGSVGAPSPISVPGVATTNSYAQNTAIPECYPSLVEHPLYAPTTGQNSAYLKTQPLYYYPSSDLSYKKVTLSSTGTAMVLTLPQALEKGDSTTVLINYTVSGLVHKKLGVYNYEFKTLKTDDQVSDVTVAVSVDENYKLADVAADKVNYRPTAPSSGVSAQLQSGVASSGVSATDTTNYLSSIGGNGNIVKHATQLAPKETFTVAGRYASSTFLLNWPRTVLRWGIAILLLGGLIAWYFIRRRKIANAVPSNAAVSGPNSEAQPFVTLEGQAQVFDYSRSIAPEPAKNRLINLRALPFYGLGVRLARKIQERRLRPLFFAWLCALPTALLLGLVLWLYSSGLAYTNSSSAYSSQSGVFMAVVSICLTLVAFLLVLLLCVGLPILYARSFKVALRIVFHIIVFFAVVGTVFFVLAVKRANSDSVNFNCGYASSNCQAPSILN